MRLLVTNDDGPPNVVSSPFIQSFVQTLQEQSDHVVCVVLPHVQRSWIGKAHFPGESIYTTPYDPENGAGAWTLLNGSPACCVQLGISYLFPSTDVVIAGPNLGCNVTTIFALSSGTLGAAFEGACLERKAIAVSYENHEDSEDSEPPSEAVIMEANRVSLRIINWLLENWDENVAVYNVNVPVRVGVEKQDVFWTKIMENSWRTSGIGGAYRERTVENDAIMAEDEVTMLDKADKATVQLRSPALSDAGDETVKPRIFDWEPTYGDIWRDIHREGSDAWAIHNGYPSITSLRANFAHVPGYAGKISFSRAS